MYSDCRVCRHGTAERSQVSIPWRGFVVFRPGFLGRCTAPTPEFQSPGGDSLYSDGGLALLAASGFLGFNPLAGIRCIQTCPDRRSSWRRLPVSIPWRGFVVFRLIALLDRDFTLEDGFNPLAGIRCIQTQARWMAVDRNDHVSIPWRGFVVFRRSASCLRQLWHLVGFNPLAGIRCIQTQPSQPRPGPRR